MRMTGAKILMECLIEQGVDTIFGYPGGTILNVYDELYSYEGRVRHILTAHEQGACHAADGYARSTGKVGVCFSTSGPGATNLVTGIATAYMDSSPIVCITCNVGTGLLGKDSFSGGRHHRRDDADHQVQLPRARRQRPRRHGARGVRHRPQRPARSGAVGHSQERHRRVCRLHAPAAQPARHQRQAGQADAALPRRTSAPRSRTTAISTGWWR